MNLHRNIVTPRFDAFDLSRGSDPYLNYARLREAGPLLRGGPGVWVVPRYREVAELLRDPRLGQFQFQDARLSADSPSRSTLGDGPAGSFLKSIVVASNGADHARVRKAIGQAFTPHVSNDLRRHIAHWVDERLAAAAALGRLEAVSELAYPLPLRVLGHLFGIPGDQADRVGRQSLKLARLFVPVIAAEDRVAADEAVAWLRDYVGSLLDARAQCPTGDVTWALASAARGGLVTRNEVVDNCIFLIFAGLETSMNLIAAGCAALAQHPGELARLRISPDLVPNAIEEFLRYDAPSQMTARVVLEPVELCGQIIRRGRVVLLLLGSANNDETQFREPRRLDVGRDPNPHVSFGGGAHYCLGAGLARMESEILFTALAHRFRTLEPASEFVREPVVTPRIYSSVPVRLGVG